MGLINRFLLQTTALAAFTLVTSSVMAQPQTATNRGGFSSMMGGGGMTPDYMLRDLPRFEAALDLTSDQVMIVEQILRDYDESFREASTANREGISSTFQSMRGNEDDPAREQSRALRDRTREIREKINSTRQLQGEEGMSDLRDRLNQELQTVREEQRQLRVDQWQSPERQSAFEEVALLMQDQLRLKRMMRLEFEGDLAAILTENQHEMWPPLQRQLVRDRLLPRGRLSGETVDVMGLVDQQQFDDDILTRLLPVLSDWDESVTIALTARDEHLVENQGELMAAMRTMDTNAGVNIMEVQATLAESVRDINDTAVQGIVLLLPEDEKYTFDSVAKERGYPRIYRTTQTQRRFQAAMELEDIEPDILQAVVELYDALNIEITYANGRIYEATHRWEAQEQLDRMNRFAQRMTGGSSDRPESPIRKAQDDRRLIEDNYLEQLRMLLTPEQIEELGGLESRSSRNRDRGQFRSRNDSNNDRGGRGDFGGGREEFMQRFDKNGDGTIDESERTAIRDFFRNGRGGSPREH